MSNSFLCDEIFSALKPLLYSAIPLENGRPTGHFWHEVKYRILSATRSWAERHRRQVTVYQTKDAVVVESNNLWSIYKDLCYIITYNPMTCTLLISLYQPKIVAWEVWETVETIDPNNVSQVMPRRKKKQCLQCLKMKENNGLVFQSRSSP